MTQDAGQRVQRFLGEFRMMVTAVGVLVAFQLQAAFSSAFSDIEPALQRVHVVGMLVGIAAFASFLIPASVHRIASQAENEERFVRLARGAISAGFLLLGVALVLGVFVQSSHVLGRAWGFGAAGVTLALLAVAWSAIPRLYAAGADERR